jgi:hypothetical protein
MPVTTDAVAREIRAWSLQHQRFHDAEQTPAGRWRRFLRQVVKLYCKERRFLRIGCTSAALLLNRMKIVNAIASVGEGSVSRPLLVELLPTFTPPTANQSESAPDPRKAALANHAVCH